MEKTSVGLSLTALLHKCWHILLLLGLGVAAFFLFLEHLIHDGFVQEVRRRAQIAAIGTAVTLPKDALKRVLENPAIDSPHYLELQEFLRKLQITELGIRNLYIMRRSEHLGARPSDYAYVVDAPTQDHNHNGKIDRDEVSEMPGTGYDASHLPAMVNAWNAPDADPAPMPDPPYPDALSGYAPIKDESGKTLAIVGADITAAEISGKLFITRLFLALGAVALYLLLVRFVLLGRSLHVAADGLLKVNAELQKQNDKLQESIKLRQNLSHMIVHDLRNALMVFSGCGYVLRSDSRHGPEQERALAIMESKSAQMLNYLEDMLILAKSEHGKLVPRLTGVDMGELAGQVIEVNRVIAQPHGVSLRLELKSPAPLKLQADPELMSRVLDNLVNNAIKYSPLGGTVRMELSRVEGDGKRRLVVKVSDEGRGMDENMKIQIFEFFSVGGEAPQSGKQFGLGLAFCKMAVEAHQGRIYLEEGREKGACFVVEI